MQDIYIRAQWEERFDLDMGRVEHNLIQGNNFERTFEVTMLFTVDQWEGSIPFL